MACGCSPVHHLAMDPAGRQRVVEAAKIRELRERGDLQAVMGAGPPPPCRPPLGPPPKPRPECPVAQVASESAYKDCKCAVKGSCKMAQPAPADNSDCKCAVKGACKKLDCKRVRFSDEVLPEEAVVPEAAGGPGVCTRVPVSPPAPRWACEPHDRATPPPASGERSDKDRTSVSTHGPCDCPCWSAYSPSPPSTLATGDIYRTCRLPKRFQYPAWFSGYNTGPKHPLYRTTASDIGRLPPTVHTVPTIFRVADRSLSKTYGPPGPWRNRSLCSTGSIWEVYSYNNFY